MAVVSSENSTDVPLVAGGEFSGEFVKASTYATVSVLIHSDQASANDGLRIEWSTDAEHVDDRQTFDYVGTASALGLMVMATVRAQYMRVRYLNTSLADQSFMRLQTLLHDKTPSASIGYIGQDTSANDDALVVKAVLAARDINTGTNVVLPFATSDPFLIADHPPNRSTVSQRTVTAFDSFSQALDLFGIFGGTRRWFSVYNDTVKGNLYVRLGGTASTTSYDYKVPPRHHWVLPHTWGDYSGGINGIWDVADGAARTVEHF